MEPSLSRYFNCNEPQSEASKKFDYVAAVHICIEVQVHSVICLPDVFKVEKKKKTTDFASRTFTQFSAHVSRKPCTRSYHPLVPCSAAEKDEEPWVPVPQLCECRAGTCGCSYLDPAATASHGLLTGLTPQWRCSYRSLSTYSVGSLWAETNTVWQLPTSCT